MQVVTARPILNALTASMATRSAPLTQTAATPSASSPAETAASKPGKSAQDEFLGYARMTPAQKMRAAILSGMKITEDELAAMSLEDRQKIEDQIKEIIKDKIKNGDENRKGALVDLKA